MQKIESVSDLRSTAAQLKAAGKTLALVPTSGALHAGHAALIAAGKAGADAVIVSVFANPLAFGPSENFAGYPRTPEADLHLCAEAGVDAVFLPPGVEAFYPRGFSTYVAEEAVSKPLCGVSRPSHFRGVVTFFTKLLNLVRPDKLILGQRDAQQVAVLRKLIADLGFTTEIVVVPTVREPDGLAVGVKNQGLTPGQRQEARSLFLALERAREMAAQGVRSPDRVIAEVTHLLGERRRVRVIYIAIVDPHTMEPMREVVPGRSLLALAAWIDEVRFIDNVVL